MFWLKNKAGVFPAALRRSISMILKLPAVLRCPLSL